MATTPDDELARPESAPPEIDPAGIAFAAYPPRPRPGVRCFAVETAGFDAVRMARVGLDADDMIDDELQDYRASLAHARERGVSDDDHAASEDDRAVWERKADGAYRVAAVIRPLPGGDPEVVRFDDPEEDRRPRPTTAEERHVWELVKHFGAKEARDAILDRMYPGLSPGRAAGPLTLGQTIAGDLGDREAVDRLLFAGPYEVIRDAIDRLGRDAVDELRRMAEERRASR